MPKNPRKFYAKDLGRELTQAEKLWNKAIGKAERRVRSWESKFRAKIDLPEKPKRVTEKAVERLEQLRWKELSERKKSKARERYQYEYDEGRIKLEVPTKPINTDESGYLNGRKREEVPPPKDKEPVDTREQLEALLAEVYGTIELALDIHDLDNPDAKNELKTLLDNAVQRGNEGLYRHLMEKGVIGRLNKAALETIKYHKEWRGAGGEAYQSHLQEFVSILNMDVPLTDEQSAYINETGTFNFDYSDYDT